jgi:arylsulfatase A-like enzyme
MKSPVQAGPLLHDGDRRFPGAMYLDCTTDYQAKVSGIAGRASFIASELPVGTGMTTRPDWLVGRVPAGTVAIATALKAMGYVTGQFGRNHLGDRNGFPPPVHGFDLQVVYRYQPDAMKDAAHPGLTLEARVVGRRG